MLKSLKLKNFRAFRDQQFDFSKINVFIGPNNSGKSSALSAINLIAQSVLLSETRQDSPVILNGQFEELGTFIDAVHGNRSNTPMGIDIAFGQREVSLEFKLRSQRREIELSKFELLRNRKTIVKYLTKKDGYELRINGRLLDDLIPNLSKTKPEFISFWPMLRGVSKLRFGRRSGQELVNTSKSTIDKVMNADTELRRSWFELRDIFSKFDSIGPFRDKPSRTYLYTGEAASHIGQTGSNSMTLLLGDASRRGSKKLGLESEISRWFKATGIGQEVVVKNLTPRHCEVCVTGNDGIQHNICDVGFGCSQVLPVLIGAMNLYASDTTRHLNQEPIFIVQEPEIHLHPNAQAELGTFFVETLKKSGQLFIETHSDNLVLRVARHVALGDLDPSDVKFFFVSDNDGEKEVQVIQPKKDGGFEPNWPGGFFPQRQLESLALAKAGMKPVVDKNKERTELLYPEEK